MSGSLSSRARSFDALYQRDLDPWDFETSEYEHAKRAATIASLDGRRFKRALELGCSTGKLTTQLLDVCDAIVATDISPIALGVAKRRSGLAERVDFRLMEAPREWPAEKFDLIVCSEVLYFMDEPEIALISSRCAHSLQNGGVCMLVNWTGENTMPVSGDDAVRLFHSNGPWLAAWNMQAEDFRIDLLRLLP